MRVSRASCGVVADCSAYHCDCCGSADDRSGVYVRRFVRSCGLVRLGAALRVPRQGFFVIRCRRQKSCIYPPKIQLSLLAIDISCIQVYLHKPPWGVQQCRHGRFDASSGQTRPPGRAHLVQTPRLGAHIVNGSPPEISLELPLVRPRDGPVENSRVVPNDCCQRRYSVLQSHDSDQKSRSPKSPGSFQSTEKQNLADPA